MIPTQLDELTDVDFEAMVRLMLEAAERSKVS